MSAREAALLTLVAMERQKAWSNGHLKKVIQEEHLDKRDAALATRLCFGVVQNKLLLDHYIQQFSTMKLQKMESKVRNSLRLGLYQMLFLTKIPVTAAVNESVELTKKHCKNPRAGGLVNGILRNLARNINELPALDRSSQTAYFSLLYSHPQWLVETWAKELDGEELETLLRWDNSEPPVTVQVNTCRFETPKVVLALEREGVNVLPHPWLPDCLVLTDTGDLTQRTAWQEGMFYPQDPAARLAVLAAGLQPGETVLDACAAPGGKSLLLIEEMQDEGRLVSCDVSENRVQLIRKAVERMGFAHVEPRVSDGTRPDADLPMADAILVDAPCSGLGILAKKPDIRYKTLEKARHDELLATQSAILDTAAAHLKEGGRLVYSTCTIDPAENEEQVRAFVGRHPEFRVVTPDVRFPAGMTVGDWGALSVPTRTGMDGFFLCAMQKRDS